MGTGRLPWNQIAALPLITAESFANPGDVTILGKTVTRRWGPSANGIDGSVSSNAADPRTPGQAYLITNWLDFTGMHVFSAHMACRSDSLAGDGPLGWAVNVIPGAVEAGSGLIEPIPFPPGPDNRNLTGNYANPAYGTAGSLNLPVPAAMGGPFPHFRSGICSWEIGELIAGTQGAGGLGPAKLLLHSNTGADPCFCFLTLYARN